MMLVTYATQSHRSPLTAADLCDDVSGDTGIDPAPPDKCQAAQPPDEPAPVPAEGTGMRVGPQGTKRNGKGRK